jgi:hypothetical protein
MSRDLCRRFHNDRDRRDFISAGAAGAHLLFLHVTRHTSHVTRHTSHVARYPPSVPRRTLLKSHDMRSQLGWPPRSALPLELCCSPLKKPHLIGTRV